MNAFSIIICPMKDKQTPAQDWLSLSKEDQKKLKSFFTLLYKIDRRLKEVEEKLSVSENCFNKN